MSEEDKTREEVKKFLEGEEKKVVITPQTPEAMMGEFLKMFEQALEIESKKERFSVAYERYLSPTERLTVSYQASDYTGLVEVMKKLRGALEGKGEAEGLADPE